MHHYFKRPKEESFEEKDYKHGKVDVSMLVHLTETLPWDVSF